MPHILCMLDKTGGLCVKKAMSPFYTEGDKIGKVVCFYKGIPYLMCPETRNDSEYFNSFILIDLFLSHEVDWWLNDFHPSLSTPNKQRRSVKDWILADKEDFKIGKDFTSIESQSKMCDI